MAHKHVVADSDHEFLIDATTRQMDNQGSKKLYFIQGDINSERLTFKVPATIEGHDMSKCTSANGGRVEIHFTNTSATGVGKNERMVILDDLAPSAKDESYLTCSWVVPREATEFAGSLIFSLRFICLNESVVEYAWNTAVYSAITIQKGLNNGDEDLVEYTDSLEQWVDTFQNAAENNHIYAITDDGSVEDITKMIDEMYTEHEAYESQYQEAVSRIDALSDEHSDMQQQIDHEMVTLASEQRITGKKTFGTPPTSEHGFTAEYQNFSVTYDIDRITVKTGDTNITYAVKFPGKDGKLVVDEDVSSAKNELQTQINTLAKSGSSKFIVKAPGVSSKNIAMEGIDTSNLGNPDSDTRYIYGLYAERTYTTEYTHCYVHSEDEDIGWKAIGSEYVEIASTAIKNTSGMYYEGTRYLAKFVDKVLTIRTESYKSSPNGVASATLSTPLINVETESEFIVDFFNASDYTGSQETGNATFIEQTPNNN